MDRHGLVGTNGSLMRTRTSDVLPLHGNFEGFRLKRPVERSNRPTKRSHRVTLRKVRT